MQTTVAVTGGASGLGRVIASTLLERGRSVVLLDRDDQQAHETADQLTRQHGSPVAVIVAHLGTLEGIHAARRKGAVGASVVLACAPSSPGANQVQGDVSHLVLLTADQAAAAHLHQQRACVEAVALGGRLRVPEE